MKRIFVICYLLFVICGAHGATLINDTETERVLYKLIEPLADAADIPNGRLKIHIINDDDFNAFVRGGEDVFLHTGLLTQIKSSDALQAVVAHEMGHMIGGHLAQMSARMDAEMTRSLIVQALGIGMIALNPAAGAGMLAGASGIARQSLMAFSRDEERMADDLAIKLLTDAKLNPFGLMDVLEQMQNMSDVESRINPNNSNHPMISERLKNVNERLKRYKRQEIRDKSNFKLVQAKLNGYLSSVNTIKTMYPTSDKSDNAIYARAIANMRFGNLAGAKTGTQTLISHDKNNPYYYELLGDCEYQFGHYDDSVNAYEHSLELIDDAPQIETALALVLTERKKPGDISRAIELCKRALLREQTPLTYWVLARAYGDDDGHGDWARAEYYNLIGKKLAVKKYAKRAQSKLQKNSPEYIKAGDLL